MQIQQQKQIQFSSINENQQEKIEAINQGKQSIKKKKPKIKNRKKIIRKLKRSKYDKMRLAIENKEVICKKQEMAQDSKILHQDEIIENDESNEKQPEYLYREINPLSIPVKEVAMMSPQDREQLKKNHPNLAEYIFLTPREKSKFFHDINLGYRQKIQVPGNMKARKIQFKRSYEVMVFQDQDPPAKVKQSKKFKDKYDKKIHFS